jgi:hypothetical protein
MWMSYLGSKVPLNDTFAVAPTVSRPPARQSFAALRHSGYRAQFLTCCLALLEIDGLELPLLDGPAADAAE